jgi:PhnB protein
MVQKCPKVVVALTVENAQAAIQWYTDILGAVEVFRIPDNQGGIAHAALELGDSVITINSEYPASLRVSPNNVCGTPGARAVACNLFVGDAQVAFDSAVGSGATPIEPVATQFWGDRTGIICDPFGHHWKLSQNMMPQTPQDIVMRGQQVFNGGR